MYRPKRSTDFFTDFSFFSLFFLSFFSFFIFRKKQMTTFCTKLIIDSGHHLTESMEREKKNDLDLHILEEKKKQSKKSHVS